MTIIIPEGFTPHDGNGCPVDSATFVQVLFDDGIKSHTADASYWFGGTGNWWNWKNDIIDEGWHIIAYRVVKP